MRGKEGARQARVGVERGGVAHAACMRPHEFAAVSVGAKHLRAHGRTVTLRRTAASQTNREKLFGGA